MVVSLQAARDAIEDARRQVAFVKLNIVLLWGAVLLLTAAILPRKR